MSATSVTSAIRPKAENREAEASASGSARTQLGESCPGDQLAGSAVARGVGLERVEGDGDEAVDSCHRSQILGGSDGVDAELG